MKQSSIISRSKSLFLLLLLSSSLTFLFEVPQAHARYAAIVMDAENGRVLHAVNPDTRNYPASLTKMMTLYMVFDAIKSGKLALQQQLIVSRRAAGMSPSKLGLKKGETIRVESAILSLVTKSANDAAVVVAEAIGGTEIKFARMMTDKAKELGMRRTTFRNASGLPNRRQRSTARDMAQLARHLIQDFPGYYNYFSREQYVFRGKMLVNHNSLLKTFPGTDGIKTGYIRASGFNLAASATRDDRRLIGVVFGGKSARSRDRHMASLLERGFKKIARSPKTSIPVRIRPKPMPVAAAPTADPVLAPPVGKAAPDIAAPAVSQPQEAQQPAADPNEWAIQVGAYGDINPARRAARRAIARMPKLSGNTRISIAPYHSGDRLMYRARLLGMSGSDARTACKRLERRKIPCIALPPNRSSEEEPTSGQTAERAR